MSHARARTSSRWALALVNRLGRLPTRPPQPVAPVGGDLGGACLATVVWFEGVSIYVHLGYRWVFARQLGRPPLRRQAGGGSGRGTVHPAETPAGLAPTGDRF